MYEKDKLLKINKISTKESRKVNPASQTQRKLEKKNAKEQISMYLKTNVLKSQYSQ